MNTKKSGVLDGSLAYLPGPMENLTDVGRSYRQEIRDGAKGREMKIIFLDPSDKFEGYAQEDEVERDKVNKMKESGEWENLTQFVKRLVRIDLRSVDISDFSILYVDPKIHMCGSYNEAFLAGDQNKPVLIIIEGGKKKCPGWLFGKFDWRLMFDSIDDCLDYLEMVDKEHIELDDRWLLMRKQIEVRKRQLERSR